MFLDAVLCLLPTENTDMSQQQNHRIKSNGKAQKGWVILRIKLMGAKIFTVLRTWLISVHKKDLFSISRCWSEKKWRVCFCFAPTELPLLYNKNTAVS